MSIKKTVASIFVLLLATEFVLALFFWISTGSFKPAYKLYPHFSRFELRSQQIKVLHEDSIAEEDEGASCTWGNFLGPHPYIGFYYNEVGDCVEPNRNGHGFLGPPIPEVYESDFYTILVTGGSVAESIIKQVDKTNNRSVLENILNERWISPNKKKFRVLNASISAGQQPMTFIISSLLLDKVDHIISIEGFNEHFRMNDVIAPEAPKRIWKELVYGAEHPFKFVILRHLTRDIQTIEKNFLKYSYTKYIISTAVFNKINGEVKKFIYEKNVFPLREKTYTPKGIDEYYISQYLRYVQYAAILAKSNNKKYTIFTQSSVYFHKPLTTIERGFYEKIGSSKESFSALNTAVAKLSNEVDVESLEKIYENVKNEIYLDPVHTNAKGTDIMVNAIAEKLAKRYSWKKKSP